MHEKLLQLPSSTLIDSQLVWFALFALATIGVSILFISSSQMLKVKKIHNMNIRKRKEYERTQTKFLTKITEDIHSLTRKTQKSRSVSGSVGNRMSAAHISPALECSEERLLDTTESLIEYLKLKSEKIQIKNQNFNLNNVLNDISGSLASEFEGSNTELIFDTNHDVPRNLTGDSVHIGQILLSLLRYSILNTKDGEVRLEISISKSFKIEQEIEFKVTSEETRLRKKDIDTIFEPEYDDDMGEYRGLELFVARELSELMRGGLTIGSISNKQSIFVLTLPFRLFGQQERRKYRLPRKTLTSKKVLIVDNNHNSSLAIKKMFSYFKHRVNILSGNDFLNKKPNMAGYDIVVLHESFFVPQVVSYIENLKKLNDLHIIALGSIFSPTDTPEDIKIIDKSISKPFSQEQIFEIIVDLFDAETKREARSEFRVENSTQENKLDVHRDSFVEASSITIDSFADFAGANLLIAEDNVINQKVLMNILGKSNINLHIVDNGKEALSAIEEDPERFDMILMDISMPVMDGYEATRAIRAEEKFSHLPVVALSALVLENEIKKMFQSGVNGYIQKPLSLGMLYSALEVFIGIVGDKNKTVVDQTVRDVYLVNTKQGIANANNNPALYSEVLKEFVEAYGDTVSLVEEMAINKKYDNLKAFALDMKGLSGTIGAYRMHDLMDRILKSILYNNQHFIADLLKEYREELPSLVTTIKGYVS